MWPDLYATVLCQLELDPRKLEAPRRRTLKIGFSVPIKSIVA